MSTYDYPTLFTIAELVTARRYLTTCVEQNPAWQPQHTSEILALSGAEVIDRTLRLWPEGWDHFRETFADEIRASDRADAEWRDACAAWLLAAEQATRGRLFPRHLRMVALEHHMFYPSPGAAVRGISDLIAIDRADGLSWRDIGTRIGAPTAVVIAWAIEARAHAGLARIARPISTSVFQ